MDRSSLRIDPRLPICWEDVDTLRIGFETAAVRFSRPSAATQRVISGFRTGLPLATRTARRFGASIPLWKQVVELLAPVLVECPLDEAPTRAGLLDRPSQIAPARLLVSGGSRAAGALRTVLAQSGFSVSASPALDPLEVDPTLLVVVQQFLEPLGPEQLFAAERIPQLLVRFTDRSVWIGPLAPPLGSPCVECAAHHDVEHDPALPVLAAQLLGREAGWASPLAVLTAAGLVCSAIERMREGDARLRHGRLRAAVDRDALVPTAEFHSLQPHPQCRCADPVRAWGHPGIDTPASATNLDGSRRAREPPAAPEMRSTSRARVSAT